MQRTQRAQRWIKRGLFVTTVLLAASGFAMQQMPHVDQPFNVTPSTLILTIVGIVAGWMTLGKFAERQIDARLLAADSPFVKHCTDPMAHEAMRKQFKTDYDIQVQVLHDRIDQYKKEDGDRIKQIGDQIVTPLLELNSGQRQVASDTLKHMADSLKQNADSIAALAETMKLVLPTLRVRDARD